MKQDGSSMQQQVLEVAIRRFSHFGISKTTLSEIADDLSITKQSLAYYFHDKQSLIEAAEELISGEYREALESRIQKAVSVEKALLEFSSVKNMFLERYYMMANDAENIENASGKSLYNWRDKIRLIDNKILTGLFETGVATGELKPLDPVKTSELFLDTLYAFSRCIRHTGGLPDMKTIKEVFAKQQEVIKIFYQGLKSETWKA